MSESSSLKFQHKCLVQQGYQGLNAGELRQLEWGLRFTPAVCSALTVVGLVLQLPALLFAVSALGIWAFFAPAAHPMDLLYNNAIRPLLGAVKLPPNPFPRRLACLAAGVMNSAAAVLFLVGAPYVAIGVGVTLLFLQAIVIFSHFCTLSWMLEGIVHLVKRKKNASLDSQQVQTLLSNGALLIDVRTQSEFVRDHLQGAMNVPLDQIKNHKTTVAGNCCLLYCASGMRSRIASKQLRSLGVIEVHNLGSLTNARKMMH